MGRGQLQTGSCVCSLPGSGPTSSSGLVVCQMHCGATSPGQEGHHFAPLWNTLRLCLSPHRPPDQALWIVGLPSHGSLVIALGRGWQPSKYRVGRGAEAKVVRKQLQRVLPWGSGGRDTRSGGPCPAHCLLPTRLYKTLIKDKVFWEFQACDYRELNLKCSNPKIFIVATQLSIIIQAPRIIIF